MTIRSRGSFADRLFKGVRWTWTSADYRAALPADLDQTVMSLDATDRLHAKQGRSTARVRFDSPWGPLAVYLKRHYRLPWPARVAALLHPSGRFTPAAHELAHLERARRLGVTVPDAVAAGERIGPWGRLQSFLMVAELTGSRELNEILPDLAARLNAQEFARLKREIIAEMAAISARLHRSNTFHKDLYLCHFFLDPRLKDSPGHRLTLIDLHRLAEHRLTAWRWRWKDLGQLLYSTYAHPEIDDRDRLRFWMHYRRSHKLPFARWQQRRSDGQGRALSPSQFAGRRLMRLAITFQRVDPTKGGAETYVADLCRGLVARGHEVHLFANEWNADELPRDVVGHKVSARGSTKWRKIRDFAANSECELKTSSYDCILGFINTWHQDVLIPQGGVHEASLEANSKRFPEGWRRSLYRLAKRMNPKSWWLYRSIEAKQYDPARRVRVVAVSEMVRNHLQKYHRVPPDRIRVIPNAIDAHRLVVADPQASRDRVRGLHGLANDDLVALFVGHNFRLKGLPALLQSLAARAKQGPSGRKIHLLVCGGGRLGPMKRLVEHLNLSETVHLVGFADDIRDYYHAADFFVLPSYYDPCSLVVFEALACGLPVITTACNGAGELIAEGREGFVIFRPDDHAAMIAALDRMTDDSARKEMSRHAMELGRAQSFDRHLARLLDLCTEVAAAKSSRASSRTPHFKEAKDASHRSCRR